MTSPARQQRGIRLHADTWMGIRLASVKLGVSASNLIEALAGTWTEAHAEGDEWAEDVITRARGIRDSLKNGKKPESAGIAADYAGAAE